MGIRLSLIPNVRDYYLGGYLEDSAVALVGKKNLDNFDLVG